MYKIGQKLVRHRKGIFFTIGKVYRVHAIVDKVYMEVRDDIGSPLYYRQNEIGRFYSPVKDCIFDEGGGS